MSKPENDRRIDYVEFAVTDLDRASSFYERAFGWTITDHGPEYRAFADGRLEGGFTTQGQPRSGGPLIVLYAQDLENVAQKVLAAGGHIVKGAYAFPGGRRFHFTDPDGYELAVWSKD